MEAYVAQVNSDPVNGMKEYLEKYFYSPKSWTEYLSLIGMEELLEASQRGRSIYND
jgi:glutaconate CoA-transferase subunit A